MLSLPLLALLTTPLITLSVSTVTITTTLTTTTYLPLEQCCQQSSLFSLGTMAPKPATLSTAASAKNPSATPATPAGSAPPTATSDVAECKGPIAEGADCSLYGSCCAGLTCDAASKVCVGGGSSSSPLATSSTAAAPAASSTNVDSGECVGPIALGADCSASGGCCGGLACDVVSETCVADDSSSSSTPAASTSSDSDDDTSDDSDDDSDDACVGPSTMGADCTATSVCCGGSLACDVVSYVCVSNNIGR